MASDCAGPTLLSVCRWIINQVESKDFYQLELFNYSVEHRWIPNEDRLHKEEYFTLFPYESALSYVRSYEQAS
jgi:hypothetical protein